VRFVTFTLLEWSRGRQLGVGRILANNISPEQQRVLLRRATVRSRKIRIDATYPKYAVDLTRVYLTGHSLGGFGTWYLAYKHPGRFAAIAPMSADPFAATAWVARLKNMPIWAFHGANDSLAPIRDTQELVDALKALGNNVRFTVLPNRDHYILDTYENQELYS
jgi:predicted peptidase